ncbi:MAG TPA: DUF4255 domain-containing protein [Burkholderiales bacterium]|nr:DUF4255 domain-containing protein [Burkholderiales bacterium]
MSSALAIAAVTASLKDRLNDGLLDQDLSHIGSFSVTAQPPDRINTGATEGNVLNVFLYQVTPNLGWRNADLPSRDNGGARVTNPPLALDLHYLLTAYGSQDMNAEILLGYAMQLLHEFPSLSRQQLRTALGNPLPPVDGALLPGPFGTMSAVDLADQVELIKITPAYLTAEDLSKLWTAMQARYRPSMGYLVSVVLIQGTGGTKAALPVLKRGPDDRGPVSTAAPFPTLASVRPAVSDSLPAMRLGDDLIITGANLNSQGGATAIFENAKAGLVQELTSTAATIPGALAVNVPAIAGAFNKWAVGMYAVSLRVPGPPAWVTNGVPIALAPIVAIGPPPAPPNFHAGDIVTVTCTPRLLAEQEANTRVIFGSQTIAPTAFDTPSATPADLLKPTTLTFAVPAVSPGSYTVRLRVDGIDSLPITVSGSPPKLGFDVTQRVNVL